MSIILFTVVAQLFHYIIVKHQTSIILAFYNSNYYFNSQLFQIFFTIISLYHCLLFQLTPRLPAPAIVFMHEIFGFSLDKNVPIVFQNHFIFSHFFYISYLQFQVPLLSGKIIQNFLARLHRFTRSDPLKVGTNSRLWQKVYTERRYWATYNHSLRLNIRLYRVYFKVCTGFYCTTI